MARSVAQADLVLEAIVHHPGCYLDDLVRVCPELTWNQIFLEVDRLSRTGRLRLLLIGPGRYAVEGTTDAVSCAQRSYEAPVPMLTQERQLHGARCERCGGLMVSGTSDEFGVWRCVICGPR